MTPLSFGTSTVNTPSTHRWKVLGTGVAANASFAVAFSGIPTTAVFMRSDYHLGNTELGLALGAMGLGIAISELPWGMLTDRLGDRRVLLTGLGATAAWLAVMAYCVVPTPFYVPSEMFLAASLLIVGLLGGCVNGASGRAVMAWFREGERGLAMSIRQTALPAGGLLGVLILPAMASGHGFAFVYGVLALFCAASTISAWYWLHEPPVIATTAPSRKAAGGVFTSSPSGGLLRDAAVWRIAIAIGFLCMPQVAVLTFAAVFLHDFGRVSLSGISGSLAAVQIGAAAMRVGSGHWTDRKGNRRHYLRACSLLCALVFAALALVAGLALSYPERHPAVTVALTTTLTLGGICASAWNGIAFTELAALAGIDRVGTALALGNSFAFGSFFVVPLVIPLLLAQWSWPVVWLVSSFCALIALPLFPQSERPVDKVRQR